MDPVSLTLAVIPLLISTAEHYKTAYDAFHRLRKASREAENLRIDVVVQRSLFDDSCRNLLSKCGVEEGTIPAMLRNARHPAWSTRELQELMERVLGPFNEAFVGTLQRIQTELRDVEEKVRNCLSADIGWKARLALSKPSLDKSILQINRLNVTLNDIRIRIDDHRQQKESAQRPVATPHQQLRSAPKTRRPLLEMTIVQKVSQKVYEALAEVCNEHGQHHTLINLSPQVNPTSRCLRLELALRRPHELSWTLVREHPVWLCVESLECKEDVASNVHLPKKLEFIPTYEPAPPVAQNAVVTSGHPQETSNPGGNCHKDFCRMVYGRAVMCQSRSCIGVFNHNRGKELEVYLIPNASPTVSSINVPALMDLFLQNSNSNHRTFNLFESVRLARKLAIATLNFHSTSWLSPLWNSSKIRFLSSKSSVSNSRIDGQEPYLDVAVTAPVSTLGNHVQQLSQPGLVENAFLYKLGVLLLELAFKQPLQQMREADDERDGPAVAEYYTAMRTRTTVASVLGPAYAKVVNQCLKCNFQSCLSDLQQTELQQDVYQDVICKLGALEQRLERVWA